jgi:membrane protein
VSNRRSTADGIHKQARRVAASRARSPAEISKRGWRDVLGNAFRSLFEQQTSLAAAGIAFYIVWALFPALAVAVLVVAGMVGRDRVLTLLAWLRLDLPQSLRAC